MKRLSIEEIQTLDFNRNMKGISVKHTDVFSNDEDMILTLATIAKHTKFNVVKGQQWFTLAAKALEQSWELSEKQMTQLRKQGAFVIEFLTYLTEEAVMALYTEIEASTQVEETIEVVEVEVDEDDLNLTDFMDAFFGTEATPTTTETETVTASSPEAKEVNVIEVANSIAETFVEDHDAHANVSEYSNAELATINVHEYTLHVFPAGTIAIHDRRGKVLHEYKRPHAAIKKVLSLIKS